MKSHGTAEGWAEMLESLIVTSKHLRAAYLCWFRLHFSLCDLTKSQTHNQAPTLTQGFQAARQEK